MFAKGNLMRVLMRVTTRANLLWAALITAFAFLTYSEIFSYNTFGAETPLFYFWRPPMSFVASLRAYSYNSLMWYRPTAHDLPYWLGQHFLDWHNLVGWKLYHFTTVLAAAYAVYWLALILFPGRRLSAFWAAAYFVAQPSLYAFVMEASAFDFLHILFVLLCAGTFIRSLRAGGWKSAVYAAVAWIFFVVGLTTKEVTVAVPVYLAWISLLFLWLEPGETPQRMRFPAAILRLLPFFAMLPVYYLFHVAKMPPAAFTSSGDYRTGVNWGLILANLHKFPLWIARIYWSTDEPAGTPMYQSTLLNNVAGIGSFIAVALAWVRNVRLDKSYRLPLLVSLGWIAVFLAIPVYSGGFFWHINLPLVGYAVLFGEGISQWAGLVPSPGWRAAALAGFAAGWLVLCRANMHVELYQGTHATAFRINHSLFASPPVPAAALGKEPLIFIEDRLGMGAWWYGCYGNLFNYVYERRDIKELVFPSIQAVPPAARAEWLSHPNAYYFQYDGNYDWHDASSVFRGTLDAKGISSLARK